MIYVIDWCWKLVNWTVPDDCVSATIEAIGPGPGSQAIKGL